MIKILRLLQGKSLQLDIEKEENCDKFIEKNRKGTHPLL